VRDLDTLLERLATEAARDAVPPEPAALARRGRRRRRGQLAGAALVVAAVVAAGLVLPARLTGRTGDLPRPATAPPTDVAGAASVGGYWFGKIDASVYLKLDVTPAQRQAIRERIEQLDVVDQVYFESRAEAWARLRELYKGKPEILKRTDPALLPESFRVRLDAPEHLKQLLRALCPGPLRKVSGHLLCIDGVDTVTDDKAPLKAVLVPKPWTTTTDVTVFLAGAGRAEREAVRKRLEAIAGVAKVTYVTPAEAYRRLPERLRRDGRIPGKPTPPFSPASVPAAFHVALDGSVRVGEFHRALCGSRKTGACAGILLVLEHPRRR
jgi:cell division protein FtsX